jgi:hypothetical protein
MKTCYVIPNRTGKTQDGSNCGRCALLLLAAYVIPWDSLLETAFAAKGGAGNHGNNNDNSNRYKVCEKKELQGKDKLLTN